MFSPHVFKFNKKTQTNMWIIKYKITTKQKNTHTTNYHDLRIEVGFYLSYIPSECSYRLPNNANNPAATPDSVGIHGMPVLDNFA